MSRNGSVSTASINSSGSVDKEVLDEYMDLVSLGRDAFTSGKIKDAELFFCDALELELDTELDLVKRNQRLRNSTSVGSMSDLSIDSIKSGSPSSGSMSPRDARSLDSPTDSLASHILLRGTRPPTSDILTNNKEIGRYLEAALEDADAMLKRNSKHVKAYLKKASALSLMNRWSEAKDVYREGIKNCKGCQRLKLALDALNKAESATKRLADVSPRVAAESHSTLVRSTTPMRFSLEGCSSPLMTRKNRFNMSSWASLDNLEKVKLSPRSAKRMSPIAKNNHLRHSVDLLGSADSLLKASSTMPLSASVRADMPRFV